MKILMIFIFLLLSNFVLSQSKDAIIYFNDGTSIEGLGMIKKVFSLSSLKDEDRILFRITEEDKPDEWTYEEVAGITFTGFDSAIKLKYVKLNNFDKPFLLELVVNGNVNLYKKIVLEKYYPSGINQSNLSVGPNHVIPTSIFQNHSAVPSKREIYYLKKEGEVYPIKIGDNFIKKSANYFSDCELLVKKIKNHEFDLDNLDQMVNFYNDICSD